MCMTDYDRPTLYHSAMRKARKAHKCSECFREIQLGEEYQQIGELFWIEPKQEQEPVARVKTVGGYPDASDHTVEWLVKFKDVMSGQLLYTTPPARKPLTDEDISAIVQSMSAYTWDAHMLARLIEKAHGITE